MSIAQLFFNIDFTKSHDHILKNDSFQKEVSIHLDPSTGLITKKIEFEVPKENYLGYNLKKLDLFCESIEIRNHEYNTVYLYLFPRKKDFFPLKDKIEFIFLANNGIKIIEDNEYLWTEIKIDKNNIVKFTPYEENNSILINWAILVK